MGLLSPTWTPKVCKIVAFMAVIMGLGLLFYILLGFRYTPNRLTGFIMHGSGFGVCKSMAPSNPTQGVSRE